MFFYSNENYGDEDLEKTVANAQASAVFSGRPYYVTKAIRKVHPPATHVENLEPKEKKESK